MAAETREKPEGSIPGRLILIYAILSAGIVAAGYLYFRGHERRSRVEVEKQLSAIAELKVDELSLWRAERLEDFRLSLSDGSFIQLVKRYLLDQQDGDAADRIRERLGRFPQHHDYDQVRLLDPRGVTHMSFPAGRPPASAAVANRIAEVLQSRRVTLVDFYRHDYDRRIYLSVLVPILDTAAGNRAIAVIALRLDPEKTLYPFILRWPATSATAETLLVRREGSDVLYLSPLRFLQDAPLNHRMSLARTDVPAVMAALGRTGIVQGVDYRSAPEIAAVRAVPDSRWFLVTRMNLSEVVAPVREQIWLIAGFVTVLLFGAGAGLAFVWRQQSVGFYQAQFREAEALRKSDELFSLFIRHSPVYTYIKEVTPTTSRVLQASENFREMIGIPGAAMAGKTMEELFSPEFAAKMTADDWAVISGGEVLKLEEELNGRSYTTIKFPVVQGAKTMLAGYTIDITERKRAEEKLEYFNKLMQYIIAHARSAIAVLDRDLNYVYVSERYLSDYKVREKDVIGRHHYEVFPDLPQKWRDVHQRALRGKISSADEDPYVRDDGSVDWTCWECRPWYAADGSIGGIIVYTEVITERIKAREQVLRSLKEKDVLLKELHHRVKNNMQVIRSLLSLQAKGIADGAVRAQFEESRDRVNSMALIHEQLYRAEDLAHIDFKTYLQNLLRGVAGTYKRPEIDVSVDMENLALDVNTGIPCGLIVNELVSNCFKHAFPAGMAGAIRVGMSRNRDGGYSLTVSDGGVGLPAGLDFRNTPSLGLQLVNILVGQINGTIELARGEGTRFVIAFPGPPAAGEGSHG